MSDDIKDICMSVIVPPGCFITGFMLFVFSMNVYLTAFGFVDEDEIKGKKQIVTEVSANKGQDKTYVKADDSKTDLNKKTESVENNDSKNTSKDKPKIELPPLKQKDIYVKLWNTKEFFSFSSGKDNNYYSSMHFTPENKIDWYVFSTSVNEKCRLYFYSRMKEKGSEKLVFITSNDRGFDVTDLEKNLLWTIEIKDNECLLKKGPNKEIAYKLSKFKQKTSAVLDSYAMLDANDEIKSVSWKNKDGLFVVDGNKETKFYIPKSNLNSKNEPALAFPNIYMIDEMDLKLRNVIALEMSQLE